MPPHVRSPVQIQTPVAVPDGLHYTGAHQGGSNVSLNLGSRQVGRRRIFVQVDTGNVLGIELDRADKVDAVKKKVQAALCVPTDQSALVFGDHVLEKDLSEIRHDCPLLLTRGLYRSSSTPCLSPDVTDGSLKLKESRNQPFEIVGGQICSPSLKRLIRETVKAIESGVQPHPASGGLGGAYYFRNRKGESAAIVKPTDEEPFAPNNPKGFVGKTLGQPGLKRSIRVGETGVREVAAYLLDHNHFANVPSTVLVKAAHPIFNVNPNNSIVQREGSSSAVPVSKICSYQQFVKHDFDASEHGTSRFPVSQVHRIGILDVRILNTDRHAGNILVRQTKSEDAPQLSGSAAWERSLGNEVVLIPIDHGLCLPENLEDPYFEWLHWPQASMPFSEEELQYIASLDPFKDVEMLRKELPMLREAALRTLVICTLFLQRGAAAGLTLAEIGGMMSRELCGLEEEASELESVCALGKLEMEQDSLTGNAFDAVSSSDEDLSGEQDQFQFDLDISANREDEPWDYDNENSFSYCRSLRSPVSNGYTGFQNIDSNFAQKSFLSPVSNGSLGFHANGSAGISPLSSPRVLAGSRPGLPSLLMLQEMHPLEENADYPVSPYTPSPMQRLSRNQSSPPPFEKEKTLTTSGSFNGGAFFSRMVGVPRSVSLSSRKLRCRSRGARRAIGMRGTTSAFDMARKISEAGGDMSTPLDFSDMKEKVWARFLEYFEDLLPDAFARRKVESAKSLQRLGTSCRF
ncbi:unnamed protein product [Calypogeia fissa]